MIGIGSRVGAYEIVSQVSRGGMATLYLGRRSGHAGFARHVAIKVIMPELAADPDLVSMFLEEARLCARIDHPNVVHIEDLGEAEGQPFLVMEYVEGVSLAQLLQSLARKGLGFAPDLAVHVAMQIADGLHAAHETVGDDGALLGVVHRDVSPQNVLISNRGHVKLIDFGIAKAGNRGAVTKTGSLRGKIRYMAPEQATKGVIDRRTDIYALGVVLFEMLTMKRFVDAKDELSAMLAVRSPNPIPPSTHVPTLSEALDRVVLDAMEPNREQRIASADEMRRRLAEALPEVRSIHASDLAEVLSQLKDDVRGDSPIRALTPHKSPVSSASAEERTASAHDLPMGLARAETLPEIDELPKPSRTFDALTVTIATTDLVEPIEAEPPVTPSPITTTARVAQPRNNPMWIVLALALVGVLGISLAWVAVRSSHEPTRSLAVTPTSPPAPPLAATDDASEVSSITQPVASSLDAGAPVEVPATIDAGAAIEAPLSFDAGTRELRGNQPRKRARVRVRTVDGVPLME